MNSFDLHGRTAIVTGANAGIIRRADAVDFTEADWDAVMNVNLTSAFFLSQAAARHMLAKGRGKIINIASVLSFQGGIRVPSYIASKSALAGLTRQLACEWAGQGINVNAVAPSISSPTIPRRCVTTPSVTTRSSSAYRPATGASRMRSPVRWCISAQPLPTMYTVWCCRWMAAGWLANPSIIARRPVDHRS